MTQSTTSNAPSRHRWRRRLVAALGVWLLMCAVGWLLIPPVLKWQLESRGSAALGRTVTIQKVHFRPWSLELEVMGLGIGPAANAAPHTPPTLTASRLYLDAELQSLLRWAPVIDAFVLEQPKLHLAHQSEGEYNIDDILDRLFESDTPSASPPRFAVYNIRIQGGALDFEDRPARAQHTLRDVELHIPFLSNLASRRDVATEPKLAFVLNGSAFEASASVTPFAEHPKAALRLEWPQMAIAPYLPYWPAKWPFKPTRGHLDADLTLTFEHASPPVVRLEGRVSLNNWALVEPNPNKRGKALPLAGWSSLTIDLADIRPLERSVDLDRINWTGLEVHARRDGGGVINWQRLQESLLPSSTVPAEATTTTSPSPTWKAHLRSFQLADGAVYWQDDATTPAVRWSLAKLHARAGAFSWPQGPVTPIEAQARLGPTPLKLEGSGGTQGLTATLSWTDAPLTWARPYLMPYVQPPLQGHLDGQLGVVWKPQRAEQTGELKLSAPSLTLRDFKLGDTRQPELAWRELGLQNLEVDLLSRHVRLDHISLKRPQVAASRDKQSHWFFERWLPTAVANAEPPSPTTAATTVPQPAPGWRTEVAVVQVRDGAGTWQDNSTPTPALLVWQGLDLDVRKLHLGGESPGPKDSALKLAVKVGDGRRDPGLIQYNGSIRLPEVPSTSTTPANTTPRAALHSKGQLAIERFPLHSLEPYLAGHLNLDLVQGYLAYTGTLDASTPEPGLVLNLRGNLALDDFKSSTTQPVEELLEWRSLQLRGLQLGIQNGQMVQLKVNETALSDYFARVVIGSNGQINLQNLVKATDASATPVSQQAAAPQQNAPQPQIEFGPVALVNGKVFFSDRFIKPPYSAQLSELSGRLAAFSNQRPAPGAEPALAELDLRGRAEGTASLQIGGRLNPLTSPLAMDIKGTVRELELPPLSPYAIKYAGYGIERGKLSVDVSYRVTPDGQLEANNQIVLNQLTFGERAPNSEAPNWPIKLAVALLTDRNGVIDVNLPISGSLNDPEFKLGPLIFKIIFNLIGKAITSPFALISSALGGAGQDLQQVQFAAGVAALDAEAQKRLAQLAQAMTDRPALLLTITGQSDLEAEREAYKRKQLQNMLDAEKQRQKGAASTDDTQLLRAVYRRTDITKPRHLWGAAKDLPVPDMEALLLAAIPVSADTMRELALARAVAVKEHLATLRVPLERLFLAAPATAESGKTVPPTTLKLEPR